MKKFVVGSLFASGTVLGSVMILGFFAFASIKQIVEAEQRRMNSITSLGEAIEVIKVRPEPLV
jgi:hypothetical protein